MVYIPRQLLDEDKLFISVYPFNSTLKYALRVTIPFGLLLLSLILALADNGAAIWMVLGTLIFLGNMVITTYIYVKSSYAYEVVKANQKRVENVFENMIYSPILCKKKKTNCAKYEIKATGKIIYWRAELASMS